MFLSYQPKGLDENGNVISQLTPRNYQFEMWEDFNDMYKRYLAFGTSLRIDTDDSDNTLFRAVSSMYMGGCIYDAFVACRGYKNVLVIPSWVDNPEGRFPNRLTLNQENSYLPYGGSGIASFPIIHAYNQTHGKLTIATVKNNLSFFDFMYKAIAADNENISIARCDAPYSLGQDDYKIKGHPEEKYDAVILLDVPDGDKFKAVELKKDFAHLCVEGYELVQFNTNENIGDRVIGRKDVLDTIQKVINIMTPPNLKKENTEVLDVNDDEVVEGRVRTVVENSFKQQLENLMLKIRVH